MSTHNIGIYEETTKIIFQLSPNIIKYAPYLFCIMPPKNTAGIANSVYCERLLLSLIWVCTVCQDVAVKKERFITLLVYFYTPGIRSI